MRWVKWILDVVLILLIAFCFVYCVSVSMVKEAARLEKVCLRYQSLGHPVKCKGDR